MLDAVSNDMQSVKLYSNKILQLLSGANTGCPVSRLSAVKQSSDVQEYKKCHSFGTQSIIEHTLVVLSHLSPLRWRRQCCYHRTSAGSPLASAGRRTLCEWSLLRCICTRIHTVTPAVNWSSTKLSHASGVRLVLGLTLVLSVELGSGELLQQWLIYGIY